MEQSGSSVEPTVYSWTTQTDLGCRVILSLHLEGSEELRSKVLELMAPHLRVLQEHVNQLFVGEERAKKVSDKGR